MKRGFDWKAHWKNGAEEDYKTPISKLLAQMVSTLSFSVANDKPWGEKHMLMSTVQLKVLSRWCEVIYDAIDFNAWKLSDCGLVNRREYWSTDPPPDLQYLIRSVKHELHEFETNAPALDKEHTIVPRGTVEVLFRYTMLLEREIKKAGIDFTANMDESPYCIIDSSQGSQGN